MKSEKEKREKGKKEQKIIVVMASRRRAMKGLGRVTFPPGHHVRWWLTTGSLLGVSLLKRKRNSVKCNKTTEEVRKNKTHI